jgi:hypothetical protein
VGQFLRTNLTALQIKSFKNICSTQNSLKKKKKERRKKNWCNFFQITSLKNSCSTQKSLKKKKKKKKKRERAGRHTGAISLCMAYLIMVLTIRFMHNVS